MEKDYKTLYAELEAEETPVVETEEEIVEETPESEETAAEEVENNEETEDETTEEVETEEETVVEEKTDSANKKFAEMRVKLKEAEDLKSAQQKELDRLNSIAVKLGHKDYAEMLEVTEHNILAKEAEESGKSIEDLIERNKDRQRIAELEAKFAEQEEKIKQDRYLAVTNRFAIENKLSEEDASKMAEDLLEDDYSEEILKEMSEKQLSRLLTAYLPKKVTKQQELEQKMKIKSELPLEQTSNTNTNAEDDEVQKLYESFTKNKIN